MILCYAMYAWPYGSSGRIMPVNDRSGHDELENDLTHFSYLREFGASSTCFRSRASDPFDRSSNGYFLKYKYSVYVSGVRLV